MRKELQNTNIPLHEQQLILAHILGMSRENVLTHPEIKLTKSQKKRCENLLKRRQNYEPLAYILGKKEFYGLEFKVTPDTLIPRPETEMLVEKTLDLLRNNTPAKTAVIDVGTGSGNIIISIAKNINNYSLFGLDISKKALLVAKHNAKKNKVHEKIKFIQSDLLDCFLKNRKLKIEKQKIIIVANLPYLSKKIYYETMPDVKNFEPESALLSGIDGLDHYEKLLKQIKILKNNSSVSSVLCFMEISPEQKAKLEKIIKIYLPESKINFQKDLAGKWRVAGLKTQK